MIAASTAGSPNETVTSGSLSTQVSGTALRFACAEARAIYLGAAASRLGVAVDTLSVADGEIVSASGGRTSYWELAEARLIERDATARVPPKQASLHRVVGTPAERLDLPDKIYGRPRFVHDLEMP